MRYSVVLLILLSYFARGQSEKEKLLAGNWLACGPVFFNGPVSFKRAPQDGQNPLSDSDCVYTQFNFSDSNGVRSSSASVFSRPDKPSVITPSFNNMGEWSIVRHNKTNILVIGTSKYEVVELNKTKLIIKKID